MPPFLPKGHSRVLHAVRVKAFLGSVKAFLVGVKAFPGNDQVQEGTRRAHPVGRRAVSRCNYVAGVHLGARARIQTIDARSPAAPTQDAVLTSRPRPQEPVVDLGRVGAAQGPARRPKTTSVGKRRSGVFTQVGPWPRRRRRPRPGRDRLSPVAARLPGAVLGARALRVSAGLRHTAGLRARRYHFLGGGPFLLL